MLGNSYVGERLLTSEEEPNRMELRGVEYQKAVSFVITAVRASIPT
jgi:hypothetical protein